MVLSSVLTSESQHHYLLSNRLLRVELDLSQLRLLMRQPFKLNGQGRTRTFGVSNVRDLQSLVFAAGLLTLKLNVEKRSFFRMSLFSFSQRSFK